MVRPGNPEMGRLLADYRRRAGLTADDLARASGVKRSYITAIEVGRMNLIYPETYEPLHRALRFPGWEFLEVMGYQTDVRTEGVIPRLTLFAQQLTKEQQDLLADMAKLVLEATHPTPETKTKQAPEVG